MESESPFFSIIMPVYNAEMYVENAIQAVLHQLYTDFELIVVDDCSSDDSYSICQELAKMDSRIALLKTSENGGAARNLALNHVRGKYVAFVDSDDTIDSDLLSTAHIYLKDEQIDCLKFGCIEEYYDEQGKIAYGKKCYLENKIYSTSEEIRKQIVRMELIPLFGYLCNGIYRTSIISQYHLRLNENYRVNEDFDFNIRYFKYVKRFQCIDHCGYHYAKRLDNQSLSTKKNEDYYDLHMMKIKAFLHIFPSVESIDSKTLSNIFWLYTRFVYSAVQRKDANQENIDSFIKEIKRSELFHIYESVHFVDVSMKQKVMISLLKSENSRLLKSVIRGISFMRMHCPFIFAALKR